LDFSLISFSLVFFSFLTLNFLNSLEKEKAATGSIVFYRSHEKQRPWKEIDFLV
jgi:hypothetical protein